MENVFTWYPQPIDFGIALATIVSIVFFVTLFYISRKQKPEEGYDQS